MPLAYKPDFEEARERWDAFWRMEIVDRPVLSITSPKEGVAHAARPAYLSGIDGDHDRVAAQADAHVASRYWCADAIPFYDPSFGPDQLAAFVGAELDNSRQEFGTNWAKAFVDDWDKALPITLQEDSPLWQGMLGLCRTLAEAAKGKFVVGVLDLHSNMDLLSAVRSPERLCLDVIDVPERVDRAMLDARRLYRPVYEALREASNQAETGSIGWLPFYSPGRFATMQCDFMALIGPEQARRFVIPALEEEAALLDHSAYHYDGPDALRHLDDVLGIRDIDVIQWTPGAREPNLLGWIDLLKTIQQAGKGLFLNCDPEGAKVLHGELRPEGVLYSIQAESERQADELVAWFRRQT